MSRLRHEADGGTLDDEGRCVVCEQVVPLSDTLVETGPGFGEGGERTDAVSQAMRSPHRLLDPIHTGRSG
jgi:hypothetical protein